MVLSCTRATRSTTHTASLFASIVHILLSLLVSRGTRFRPDADMVRPLQQAQKVLLHQRHTCHGHVESAIAQRDILGVAGDERPAAPHWWESRRGASGQPGRVWASEQGAR